jgi:predicted methyltransferase
MMTKVCESGKCQCILDRQMTIDLFAVRFVLRGAIHIIEQRNFAVQEVSSIAPPYYRNSRNRRVIAVSGDSHLVGRSK